MTDEAKTYEATELGNSERMLDLHKASIRYNPAFGFVTWNMTRWQIDSELTVLGWSKGVVYSMFRDVKELTQMAADTSGDESKERAKEAMRLLAWARKSSTDQKVKAVMSLIRSEVATDPSVFDSKPMLFNCQTGTIDLTTGQLREHRREDYLTQISPITYDPGAECPTFDAFIDQIMCERDALVDYLRRVLGYAMTGEVREQEWYLLVGEGGNGKGTLMELVSYILGDYAHVMEPEAITLTNNHRDENAPSPARAALKGKRFVKVTETKQGAKLDAAEIKRQSGGDELSGRFMRKDIFRFMPTHKLFIYTNHAPGSHETTHAFWRRVRYIPFDFIATEPDTGLLDRLKAEAPGVLNWLIRGCLEWQKDGLQPPDTVLQATETYKREMNPAQRFIDECCVRDEGRDTPSAALWQEYETWCAEEGETVGSKKSFGETLTRNGYERRKSSVIVWRNIRTRTVFDKGKAA